MCGVLGLISKSQPEDFDSMFSALAHRGPDGHGVTNLTSAKWNVKLGHHRLSIIDLAGGAQPMSHSGHTITFNGEIYNFRELRHSLAGQTWRTQSDTEVVLKSVQVKGRAALPQFDGFFSFGVYNQDRNELLLARDRWGIKPLYYALLKDGGILFASELHPFLRSSAISKSSSLEAIRNYLFFDYVPYEGTILKDVKKLMPGQFVVWRDGKVETGMYYDHQSLLYSQKNRTDSNELWELVRASVRNALISDVPVGILLSGGIDSSVVAAAAREFAGPNLPTFSIGFDDAEFDESQYARMVADAIQARHYELRLKSSDLLDRWEEIILSLDEPMADPSLIPTQFLCELARGEVPVVLGGDGGDELFGGYPTYRAHSLRPFLRSIPGFAMEGFRNFTKANFKVGDGYQPLAWRFKRLLERYDSDPFIGHFRWMSGTDFTDLERLTGLSSRPDLRNSIRASDEDMQNFLYWDLLHYLPYAVLTKVDRASMSVGLECRPPLLSNACVEAAFSIPVERKVSFKTTKKILREAAIKHLPEEIVARPKRGFAIPLAKWLRNDLKEQVGRMMSESPLWERGALDVRSARVLWGDFQEGYGDHARTVWALLVLHKWIERHQVRIESHV